MNIEHFLFLFGALKLYNFDIDAQLKILIASELLPKQLKWMYGCILTAYHVLSLIRTPIEYSIMFKAPNQQNYIFPCVLANNNLWNTTIVFDDIFYFCLQILQSKHDIFNSEMMQLMHECPKMTISWFKFDWQFHIILQAIFLNPNFLLEFLFYSRMARVNSIIAKEMVVCNGGYRRLRIPRSK